MNWSCYILNTVVITRFHNELIMLPSEHSSYYTVPSRTVVLPSEHSIYYTVSSGILYYTLNTIVITQFHHELIVLPSKHSSYYTVPSGTAVLFCEQNNYYTVPPRIDRATLWTQ